MANKECATKFRSVFGEVHKQLLRWYPGHMDKGLKQMQEKLKFVDCVVEVHDARVPFSGRNTNFKYLITGIKPHIVVMNKKDLIEKPVLLQIQKKLHNETPHIIFTNCQDDKDSGVKKLLPLAQQLVSTSDRFNRESNKDVNMMIIGVPNVGKSSLINRLRNRFLGRANAAPVGAVPGITRSVQTKIKISENPLIYLYDTPGISEPKVDSAEVWLKLALCAIVQDHLVGESIIADFLLFWLNKMKKFEYVDVLCLENAHNDILQVLLHLATKNNKYLKIKNTNNEYVLKPDFHWAAQSFLKSFRQGNFGKIMLDEDLLR